MTWKQNMALRKGRRVLRRKRWSKKRIDLLLDIGIDVIAAGLLVPIILVYGHSSCLLYTRLVMIIEILGMWWFVSGR